MLGPILDGYGTFQVLCTLSVTIAGVSSGRAYRRSLDLATGIHTTQYTGNDGKTYTSQVYCSSPANLCAYTLTSSTTLGSVSIALEDVLRDRTLFNTQCAAGRVTMKGVTQLEPVGMHYQASAQVIGAATTCTGGSLQVTAGAKSFSILITTGTDYDPKKGTAAFAYSFRGADPTANIASTLARAGTNEAALRTAHLADYTSLMGAFSFQPSAAGTASPETATAIGSYSATAGDAYVDMLMFQYGRYLLMSSSRNSLPPNGVGMWVGDLRAPWSGDYHFNINLQQAYWPADQTGLGATTQALWNFVADTLVPRGTETAKLLYGAPGWVFHDETNPFGHTGMRSRPGSADYPVASAWVMQHVYDLWDMYRSTAWLSTQGYPLMKGVAQFWVSQLLPDTYTNDGTLVVNPCNSPEHGPTTFGCTHFQQLIHQVFLAVLDTASAAGETDKAFLNTVSATMTKMDKGIHIGSWGELKEWKIPDSAGFEVQGDTHRHLSELVGWYPGFSVSGVAGGYRDKTISSAVRAKLISRGIGNGPDANSGWEKVWRAACWARLNDTAHADTELKYALNQNYASNGLSMYSGRSGGFQIDSNMGIVGAMLSMLVVDLPSFGAATHPIVLGPAIPSRWGTGQVKGLRIRGGGTVDFSWDAAGMVTAATIVGGMKGVMLYNKQNVLLASS